MPGRFRSTCVFLAFATGTSPASAATVQSFFPLGAVRDVRQVVAIFSEPMVALGDARAEAPFDINCTLEGSGRWIDEHNWVWDVRAPDAELERDAVNCLFRRKDKLRTFAGKPLEGASQFAFTLPAVSKLRTEASHPAKEWVSDQQVFLFRFNQPLDKDKPTFRCRWKDYDKQAIEVNLAEAGDDLARFERRYNYKSDPSNTMAVRCKDPMPSGAQIWLLMDHRNESRSHYFERQPAFTAEIGCEPTPGTVACTPYTPIVLKFQGDIPEKALAAIRLSPAMDTPGVASHWSSNQQYNNSALTFAAPHPGSTIIPIIYPPGFADRLGRVALPGALPASVITGPVYPIAFFTHPPYSVQRPANNAVGLLVTHQARPQVVRELVLGTGKDVKLADREIRRWLDGKEFTASTLASHAATRVRRLPASPPSKNHTSQWKPQLALRGKGLHVLDMAMAPKGEPGGEMHTGAAVLITNLAVHLKSSAGDTTVWVTSLDKSTPVAGADVRVYERTHENEDALVWSGKTDHDGLARVPRDAGGDIAIVRHRDAQGVSDVAFASIGYNKASNSWSQSINGQYSRGGKYRATTVLDRSLFQPGETVSMRHLLRQTSVDGFDFVPNKERFSFQITHSPSWRRWKPPLTWDGSGSDAVATFTLPAEAPTGRYRMELRADAYPSATTISTGEFTVETFRQPLMAGRISVAPGTAPLLAGAAPTMLVSLRHANGGAAAAWPVHMRASITRRNSEADDDYDLSPLVSDVKDEAWDKETKFLPIDTRDLVLGADGTVAFSLPTLPEKATPYSLLIELSYADPNGEQQTLSEKIHVGPELPQVGLRALGQPGLGRPILLEAISTDTGGVRLAGQAILISARRAAASKVKARTGPPAPRFEELGVVCTGKSDAMGILNCPFLPREIGSYQFTASMRDARDRLVSTTVTAGVPSSALVGKDLFVHADRLLYEAGQRARLRIDLPFSKSIALLSVEREGIKQTRVLHLHGRRAHVTVPIGQLWGPNVFVTLLAISRDNPASASGKAMPAYAWGEVELKVGTGSQALRVSLNSDKAIYAPRERASIRVKVAMPDGSKVPAGSTIIFAAVDETLLALKDNASWNVLANLSWPRGNRVGTYTPLALQEAPPPQLDDAILRILYSLGKPLPPEPMQSVEVGSGGGGGGGPSAAPSRTDSFGGGFGHGGRASSSREDTAERAPKHLPLAARALLGNLLLWKPHMALDSNGEAVIELPLNEALTRFRLVAIATVGSSYFGTGSIHIDATQDVQLISGLPPAVHAGDRLQAMVTVRNASARAIKLDVSARADGIAPLPAHSVTLAAGASQVVRWMVEMPADRDSLSWVFSAVETGKPGNGDSLAVSQRVHPVTPLTVQAATFRQLDGTLVIPLALSNDVPPGAGVVNIAFQARLVDGMPGVRRWLGDYAHLCLEQRASVVMGLRDRDGWDKTMALLPNYLDPDGLATYFPRPANEDKNGSDVLNAYLLSMSEVSGWPIPEPWRESMLDGLESFVDDGAKRNNWSPRDDSLARRLAAVAALARHERATPRMVDNISLDDKWTVAMLTDWLTVLHRVADIPNAPALQEQVGKQLRARVIFKEARVGFSSEQRDYWWWLMNNGDVDVARLLLAVRDLPAWRQDVSRIAVGLLARQEGGAWHGTVANAWGTVAIDKFARQFEASDVAGRTEVTLGPVRKTATWDAGRASPLVLPLSAGISDLRLVQKGSGNPWVSVQVSAAMPLAGPHFAGYHIEKSMLPVRQKVAGRVSVGDIWRIKLSIDARTDMTWVVLSDPVPAGATILGKGLERESVTATKAAKATGQAQLAHEVRDFTAYRSYYEYVPPGRFTQEYTIRINNAGTFALPPTRVEAMYAPEVFGSLPNAPVQIFDNDNN